MAQKVIIQKGDREGNNIEKITPDVKVNQQSSAKYPNYDTRRLNYNDEVITETLIDESGTETSVEIHNPNAANSGGSAGPKIAVVGTAVVGTAIVG